MVNGNQRRFVYCWDWKTKVVCKRANKDAQPQERA